MRFTVGYRVKKALTVFLIFLTLSFFVNIASTIGDISSHSTGSITKAALPEIRADMPAAGYDGLVYVFGGYHDSWSLGQAEVFSYDPVADSWTQKSSMSYPRWGAAAAVYNDEAYVFGGDYQGEAISVVEAYNFSLDTWVTKQNLPNNVFNQGLEAVTGGSLIYLFYGSSTYSYNPQTDDYTQLASAPYNKDWAECAHINANGEERIYLLGGYDLSVNEATDTCAYYRPAFNDWITIDAAPYAAYGTLRDNPVINGIIYYGYGQGQHDSSFYDYMYSYDPSTDVWTQLPSGVYPRDGVGCAVVGSKLYIIGGRSNWETSSSPILGLDYNEEFDADLFSQLSLTVNPPLIRMYVGQSQVFAATALGGTVPYSYTWYLNGNILEGQNEPTFTFTPTTPGSYNLYASVSDANGQTVQSNTVNDIIVYSHFHPDLMVPDWSNVKHDFFNLVPGSTVEPVLTAADVTDRAADFVADPFIYHENGLWYMFFEVHWSGMDYSEIGLATSNDGFEWSYNQIVLSESFNLAYPYIFKWNRTYYMIPETYSQSEVRLYKATDFPYGWEYVSSIISSQSYNPVDSSVFRYNNMWWMFTSSESDLGYLYYSNSLEDPSAWHMHPMSPITTDNMKVRGAGRTVIFDNDHIIRLTQELYGQGVRAFQVDTLNTANYAEHEVTGSPLIQATGASGWNAQAMHTVNPWWSGNGWVAAVDGAGYDWLWSIGIYMSPLQPSITPTSTRIGLGQSQNFASIAGGGKPSYFYQWYLNDIIVPGAINQDWTFTPIATGHYKVYVKVTDALNHKVQSNTAQIAVYQPNFDFSIMQITDTQILSSSYPNLYNQLTTWIADNSATYKLKLVVHTGDIVDQYWDGSQWDNANDAMTILMNNGIPYTWCAGNHDQNEYSDPNTGWSGDQYSAFNPATFSSQSYWVGSYNQGKNTAAKFSVNEYNFLVIDLENQANSATIAWATNLLNTYSNLNYNIIVATHEYLVSPDMSFNNGEPNSPEWETNLQNLLNQYPKVFMTLNGHTHPVPYVSVHNQVNGRTQIQFDRQEEDNFQGACSARIYTFNLTTQTVDVSSYIVWNSTWIIDSGEDFSFSPSLISIPTVNINPTIMRMDVGQSQTFSSSVSGGRPPYTYQWYRNNNAVSGATSPNWTFTPTQSGNYNVYVNVTDSLSNKVKSNIVTDIIVYSQPSASISPISTNKTIGGTQQFNSSVTGGLAPYTYQWYYTNNTAISGATTPTLAYKANFTGTYNIYLNATDSLNYRFQSNTGTINVYSLPGATINPDSVNMTVGATQQFNSFVTGGLTPYNYQWYFSNGTIITGATTSSLTFKANSTGTYSIYLNVTDNLNYKTQSYPATINIYSQPSVFINPTSVNMTLGTTQQFNSTTTGGLIPYTYQWYQNDTTVTGATASTWNFTPVTTGHYKVYLNVTDILNSKVKSNIITDITVNSQPTVTIIPISINMTTGAPQTFVSNVTGGTAPYSYQWYLNNTAVLGATNASWTFNPATIGTYKIYLNVTDHSSVSVKSNNATANVQSGITVNISPTQVKIYAGQNQTFISSILGGTQPYTYQWCLNDTAVFGANSQNWTFTPISAGSYHVYLNLTDALNIKVQSNIVTNITVYGPLTVSINPSSVNMTVGIGQTFSSTVSGGASPYTYQWYLNGSQVPTTNASTWTFTPTSTGNFSIYLTVADNKTASAQSNNSTITVETRINVNITPTQANMYLGQSQTFNSTSSGGTQPYFYQWYLNDTAVLGATDQNWIYTPTATGTYKIYLTITDALNIKAQSNIVTNVTVYSDFTAIINPSSVNIIVGIPQTFTSIISGGATPYSYQWYLNGSAISGANDANWIFRATSAGTYNIYLNTTDNNAITVKSNIATAIVETQMNVNITPTQVNIYVGQNQTFSSSISGGTPPYTYQWYLNGTAVSGANSQNWIFTPTVAGIYEVYLNITDILNLKVQSNVVTNVTVYLHLNVTINPAFSNMTVEIPQMFNSTIIGGAQPYSYQWYLNDSQIPNANTNTLTFTPTTPGTFTIYLKVTDNNIESVQSNNATITVLTSSTITGFNVTSGGSGYTTPVVILTGGGGTGATATARVSNGVIISIVLTNPGSGYTSAPTVTLRDPSPRAKGASATAILANV